MENKLFTKIINLETNEIIEREFNDQEVAQLEEDKKHFEELATETAAKAAQKAALLQKLGITQEEALLLLS
jgi:phosphopantetheinyl transferase (holo-ACP synthase)